MIPTFIHSIKKQILVIDPSKKDWLETEEAFVGKGYSFQQVDMLDKALKVLDWGNCFLMFLELDLPGQGSILVIGKEIILAGRTGCWLKIQALKIDPAGEQWGSATHFMQSRG